MRRYETIFISHPDLSEEDVEKLTQRAADIVQQQGGELLQVQQWGKKKLAYKIKKQWRGYYTLLDYLAVSTAIKELERILRLDDKVMKFLTVMTDDRVDVEAVRRSMAEAKKAEAPVEEGPPPPGEPEAPGSVEPPPGEETAEASAPPAQA